MSFLIVLASLCFLMFVAYRGYSVILFAPLAALGAVLLTLVPWRGRDDPGFTPWPPLPEEPASVQARASGSDPDAPDLPRQEDPR